MATSSAALLKATVGILSIGDMGVGVARLLRHHDHTVYTVATGRSQHTLDRIKAAQIVALGSDEELVAEADIILSIVPPRDAVATARRALEACRSQTAIKRRMERKGTPASASHAPSLTYIDLNAISSRTARSIAALFNTPMTPASPRKMSLTRTFSFNTAKKTEPELDPIFVSFLDDGIIGGPPSWKSDHQSWKKPSIVVSGPRHSELLSPALVELLNIKVVSPKIGTASALKSCFASLTKGMTALSILSFTTAHSCGVLDQLQAHLEEFSPTTLALARGGLVSMPPKAYRWVEEMRQINETFVEEGGFDPAVLSLTANPPGHNHQPVPSSKSGVFNGVADIYRLVADDTVLGEERVDKRKRGTDPEDVAECVREGIASKKKKLAAGSDLEAAWRGSWGA